MSLNSINFDYKGSSFNDEANNVKDKKGFSRDGSGRATIYKETFIPYSFTLEGNYNSGTRLNTLKPRFDIAKGQKLLKEDNYISDINSKFYKAHFTYTAEVYTDVGRAYLISILDIECLNPITRLISKSSETLEKAL